MTSALTLRALAWLLRYPDAAMRARLPDIHTVLRAPGNGLSARRRVELDILMDRLLADGIEAEARYVELFDRGRGTALHLFEHVHGDSRDRGPAMIDLVQTYEEAGLLLGPEELPDHLTVLLEYASTQPPAQARAFIGEFTHIIAAIAESLRRRDSDYVAVMAVLLDLAGGQSEAGTAAGASAVADDEPLDASWEEPAAFGGCSLPGSPGIGRPPSAGIGGAGDPNAAGQPIRVLRRPPTDRTEPGAPR